MMMRSRASGSIDHDTHGRRLGQNKAQAGFERRVDFVQGSQEARALDEDFGQSRKGLRSARERLN